MENEENRAQNGATEDTEGPEGIPEPRWQTGDMPNNGQSNFTSEIEESNDLGEYGHLIETEFLQSLGKTAYRCKEHYHIWDTDLKGLEISHFEPFHEL